MTRRGRPFVPPHNLNTTDNGEGSTSESEREDEAYGEQVRLFSVAIRRRLSTATLDLDEPEPAEEDAAGGSAMMTDTVADDVDAPADAAPARATSGQSSDAASQQQE